MNALDIFLIALIIIVWVIDLIIIINFIKDGFTEDILGCLLAGVIFTIVLLAPFVIIDKASGSTVGYVTSADDNFWGTKALYLKTTENNEEKYCIEDPELKKGAEDLVGKKIKIKYGKRIGLFSTGACGESPIEYIEVLEE